MKQKVWSVLTSSGNEVTVGGSSAGSVAKWFEENLSESLGDIDDMELIVEVEHVAC